MSRYCIILTAVFENAPQNIEYKYVRDHILNISSHQKKVNME